MIASVPLKDALAVALATAPALLTVMWSLWQHNKRVEDIRDTLRAEITTKATELASWQPEIKEKLNNIEYRFGRIEDDIRAIRSSSTEIQSGTLKLNQALTSAVSEQRVERERLNQAKEKMSGLEKIVNEQLRELDRLERKLKDQVREDIEDILRPFLDKLSH